MGIGGSGGGVALSWLVACCMWHVFSLYVRCERAYGSLQGRRKLLFCDDV